MLPPRHSLGGRSTKSKKEYQQLQEARQRVRDDVARLIKATGQLLEPLRDLNEEQVASSVILSLLAMGVMKARSSSVNLGDEAVRQLEAELENISPGLSLVVDIERSLMFACLDETIACAVALAQCEADGISEEECIESWGPCSREFLCIWGALKGLRVSISEILGGLKPPRPSPWPE